MEGFDSEKLVFAKLNLASPTRVDASGLRQSWKTKGL